MSTKQVIKGTTMRYILYAVSIISILLNGSQVEAAVVQPHGVIQPGSSGSSGSSTNQTKSCVDEQCVVLTLPLIT
jgi:hypothetical protein